MTQKNLIKPFVIDLLNELQQPEIIWQIGIVLVALLAAGAIAQLVIKRWGNPDPDFFGDTSAIVNRLAFPVLGVVFLFIGEQLAQIWLSSNLIKLMFTLTVALALIRVSVYAMRRAFSNSSVLQGFERAIEVIVWVGVALYVSGLWEDLYDVLSAYEIHVGKTKLNLVVLAQGIVSVIVTVILSLWMGASIESRLMRSTQLDASFRAVLARFARALILVLALVISLSLVGIDLTVLSVFGGALGVGLGFGMQRIASNYISGFIILLDRSIRLGDLIAVDKYTGTVSQIKTRYTVIRAMDGSEAILPNELLISAPVSNFAYTDKRVRTNIRVQVSYESDLDRAMRVLKEAALAQHRVLLDPEPVVYVVDFAADGITLELGFWISDPESGTLGIKSDMNLYIYRAFKEAGVEIPYPQRTVRIIQNPLSS